MPHTRTTDPEDDRKQLALEAEEFFRAAPDDRAERRAFQRANAKVLTREA